MQRILVIGGGASGMMAAGQAAGMGARVDLLEKMNHPGNKIAISGRGRCNLTNNSAITDCIDHFNRDGRFLHQSFSRFFAPQLIQFFHEIGLPTVTERGNRVFPASNQAFDVVAALQRWLKNCGVTLHTKSTVTRLIIENNRIAGAAVATRDGERIMACDAAILATGGASYPATGSSGEGYSLARDAGHSITALRPALVPLLVNDPSLYSLAGLDLKNVGVRVSIDGKRKKVDFGEVSFTRFGIGGPVILTHSLLIVDALRAGKKAVIALDLKPALDERKLDNRLLRDFEKRATENLSSVLRGVLPHKMVAAALHFCALDGDTPAGRVDSRQRARLRTWLKDFRLFITGHRPLGEAIITAGGIRVQEINPHTMESKRTAGLFITGELLDIHGDTGGYNLQAAFSTGWIAGRCAARAD
ncbi:MAG: NAD(P)/FAD-dependent oxidoreductase [Desulfopila sp.]